MMRLPLAFALLAALASPACKKEDPAKRLPPASDWQAPPMETTGGGGTASAHGGAGADPHAGVDMGAAGADPHAGVDMGAAGGGAIDPMDAIQPPDPNRPIDDSKFLKGSIVATSETASRVKPGAIIFIAVRPIEPVTGEIIGGPIAVDRIDVTSLPASFDLSERNAMSAGTRFSGDVLITARVDADGEARSRTPGDVEGSVRAKIPTDKLELKLDTVLR